MPTRLSHMHNCRNTHKHTLKQTPKHIHSHTYFHQARTLYDRFKYVSSQTRSEVVDVPRAIQMLYMLLLPDGRFHPARYNPPRKKPADDDISKFVTLQAGPPEMQEANKIQQALTIDPVDPAQVVKGKMLGQGGQGTAFMATYNGVKVCAKYLNGQVTSQVSEENHAMPNCVCVYVYIRTCMHECIYTIHTKMHACMHAYILTYIHTCIHTYMLELQHLCLVQDGSCMLTHAQIHTTHMNTLLHWVQGD